jgi:2-hydroxychromene-2-carboxylate isomerase
MRDDRAVSARRPLFYIGAMSPYSWLAAERIGEMLPDARWRGVLAGAVFKAKGRTSWGLTERRAEGMADCEQRAAQRGLGPICWPDPWPTSDLHVARAMVFAEGAGVLEAFALAAMRLAFLESADLGERAAVLEAGARSGIDRGELDGALAAPEIKERLRVLTDGAIASGVFGVPTIALGAELYWGDDSLERAVADYRSLSWLESAEPEAGSSGSSI